MSVMVFYGILGPRWSNEKAESEEILSFRGGVHGVAWYCCFTLCWELWCVVFGYWGLRYPLWCP